MPFTQTPMQSTEQTKPIPFLQQWQSRNDGNNKDSLNENLLWDIVQDPTGVYSVAIKRDGFQRWLTVTLTGTPIGIYLWNTESAPATILVVAVAGLGLYVYNPTTGALINTIALVLGQTEMNFVEFQYNNGTVVLVGTDGSNLGFLDSAGNWTVINDPDRPVLHAPFPVYLDGYLFLTDGVSIANSDLNNPASWTAGNFLAVDAYPDTTKAIARHGVYIVAFGTASIQFFYDAGNPTGTPLARYGASAPQVGYRGGLQVFGEQLLFIGAHKNGVVSVYQLEGFKVTSMGFPTLTRFLMDHDETFNYFSHRTCLLSMNGRTVLLLSVDQSDSATSYTTYMLDMDTKFWSKFSFGAGIEINLPKATTISQYENLTQLFSPGSTGSFQLFFPSPDIYQDNGVNYTVRFMTKNHDFDTRRNKFGSRLLVSADQTPTTSLCSISWSDDDYQTFSTPRTVDLSHTFPHLPALGVFRKRAWNVTYADNFPMRWNNLELDYNQGSA